LTNSPQAEAILNDWTNKSTKFLKVAPKEAAAQTQPIAIPRQGTDARSTVSTQVMKATIKKA
jgi:hypothetical protein